MFWYEYHELEEHFTPENAFAFCRKWLKKDKRFHRGQRNLIMATAFSDTVPEFVLSHLDSKLSAIINLLLDLFEDGRLLERFVKPVLETAVKEIDIQWIRLQAYKNKCMRFDDLFDLTGSSIVIPWFVRHYSCISYRLLCRLIDVQ